MTQKNSSNLIKIGSNMSIKIVSPDVNVLFSYNTPVAARINDEFVSTSTHWSQTTTRHIKKWLQGRIAKPVPQNFLDDLAS